MTKLRNTLRTLYVMFVNRPVLMILAWGNAINGAVLTVIVPKTEHNYWTYLMLAVADIAALIIIERYTRSWVR